MFPSRFFSATVKNPVFPFAIFAMLCSFFITMEYGISRPASNAFFVSTFGATYYPYAWLAAVPLNFFIVATYNQLLTKLGCFRVMMCVIFTVSICSVFTYLYIEKLPLVVFFHYVWKDIYILLMFKQLWSLIHNTIEKKKAGYLYGIFFAMGGIGSVVGNILPSFFAVSFGSKTLFLATVPIYLLIGFFYRKAFDQSKQKFGFSEQFSSAVNNAFSFVLKKRFLLYILFLVIFMQVSVAFVEYQFNHYLEKAIPTLDLRTEYCGRVFSMISLGTTFFQIFGGFFLLEWLGLRLAHKTMPILFLLQGVLVAYFPSFGAVTGSFVYVKSMDHSCFNILREMLYLPLSKTEQFHAKAVIDVFASRSAKAIASLFLLFLQYNAKENVLSFVRIYSIGIFLLWVVLSYQMFQKDSIWAVENSSLEKPASE